MYTVKDIAGLQSNLPPKYPQGKASDPKTQRRTLPEEEVVPNQFSDEAHYAVFKTAKDRFLGWIWALVNVYINKQCNSDLDFDNAELKCFSHPEGKQVEFGSDSKIHHLHIQLSLKADPILSFKLYFTSCTIHVNGIPLETWSQKDMNKVIDIVDDFTNKTMHVSFSEEQLSSTVVEGKGENKKPSSPNASPISKETFLERAHRLKEHEISQLSDSMDKNIATVIDKIVELKDEMKNSEERSIKREKVVLQEIQQVRATVNSLEFTINSIAEMAKKNQNEMHEIYKRTGRQDTRMVQAIENQHEMVTALKGVVSSLQEIQKPANKEAAPKTEQSDNTSDDDKNKKDNDSSIKQTPPVTPTGPATSTSTPDVTDTDTKPPASSVRQFTLRETTKKLFISDSVLRNINELVLDSGGSTEVKAFGGATIEEMESIIRCGPDLSHLEDITIHIGINNTATYGYSDYKPALGKLGRTVKSRAGPFSSVTVTSALPCASRSLSVATLNDSIEAMCQEEGFQYLDLTKKFESAPGVVNENLFFDQLHPNTGDRTLIMTFRDWTSTKRPQYVEHSLQQNTCAAGNTLHMNGNVFQASATPVRDRHDIWNAVQKHKGKRGMHTARHHMYAYRIKKNGKTHEHYEDDLEPDGGKAILDRMRAKGIMNAICIVSRWTGEHLGPRRFDVFASCAMEAWNKDLICSIPLMTPQMPSQYQSQYSAPLPVWSGGLHRSAYPFTSLNQDVRQYGFKFTASQ